MIKGFSRLSKYEKQQIILDTYLKNVKPEIFKNVKLSSSTMEQLVESFSENVISIFPFPYSIAPNFLIDQKEYLIPFVTEESSVVAAAAKSAKFWYERGGFKTQIIGNVKSGHIHFKSNIASDLLRTKIKEWEADLLASVDEVDAKMKARGGGIQCLSFIDRTKDLQDFFQIELDFITCNAMGANYMNSCLEGIANKLSELIEADTELKDKSFKILMAILSNYSPKNAVKVWVEWPINELDDGKLGMSSEQFAHKFVDAVRIAEIDVSRAVTHNKGFYNGLDAVALATGNDWRAIEANGHAYASRNGQYSSLSHAEIKNGKFYFEATIPLQVGTVGGITALHPFAQLSLDILNQPNAEDLMKVMAVAGLASNFSAVKALITTGIQKGHMKMHLSNILEGLNANNEEKELAREYFKDRTISNAGVEGFLRRKKNLE